MAAGHVYSNSEIRTAFAAIGVRYYEGMAIEEAIMMVRRFISEQMQSITLSGNSPDPLSGISYDPGNRADCLYVKRAIAQRQLFMTLHPGAPLINYPEREALKNKASVMVRNHDLPLPTRCEWAEQWIAAYFARSVTGSLSADDPLSFVCHPGFREYASHYLHADPAETSLRYGAEVAGVLLARYPAPDVLRIGPGVTLWQDC
ncbi:hypothetical protein LH435_04775 [Laribacter hongkongensis]|uniref:hypothetical protein n=4 Tax=Laribacter hongkongensis TaxID=168471 RepID=UPI001EFDD3DB|nr:hypothetical protein [Laribacter hongkongensis]MCG8996630.1 hypothetical protein [Laribacter hongkongensis]MCG9073338.1 hypothetical protein [Laribacter hongkongensis]